MRKPTISSEDDISPDSWTLCVEFASNATELDTLSISFRHLHLTDIASFEKALTKPPRVSISGRVGGGDISSYSSDDSATLGTYATSTKGLSLFLDLSRNFFNSVSVPTLLHHLHNGLVRQELVPRIPNLLSCIRVVCLTSNELTSFPAFHPMQALNECPVFPELQELYINHNYIQQIPLINVENGCFVKQLPKLKVLEMRNNQLNHLQGLSHLLNNHCSLKHLSLSGNSLNTRALHDLPSCPNLRILGLFANQLDNDADETPCAALGRILRLIKRVYPSLHELYLLGNPLTAKLDTHEYQQAAKSCLPTLRYLDGIDLGVDTERTATV